MGSACCVAARDRTISSESQCEVVQRNVRYSPTWSFRWDNRGRVAGEDTSVNWFSDGGNRHSRLDWKSGAIGTANASDEGTPLDNFQTRIWQKAPISEGNRENLLHPSSDLQDLKGSSEAVELESPTVCDPSGTRQSSSVHHSISSLSTSPLSSQTQICSNSSPSKWPQHSQGQQLSRQASDKCITGLKSPRFSISEEGSSIALPGWSNESTRGSNGGSSDCWSIPTLPEVTVGSRRDRWSCDSEFSAFCGDRLARSDDRSSASSSLNIHTCGICSKLLTERSLWGKQKIISYNELAVVAVLICGHVYHAECLESMTPEISKYDPVCPVCTFGEKRVLKLSERALKTEMELKIRNKNRSSKRIVDGDLNNELTFDRQKSCGHVGRGLEMIPTSSSKSSLSKPFLRRHFSFGSKGIRTLEDHSTRKKGFFWSKSTKK